ncbi:putative reverse transcriptase domain, reverse transcriptase zinc-binding domain protein [Tanacetum coccineum]
MIGWIMECVSSTSFSISINGVLHGYFKGKRGLRQGDPLSHYLFTLVMEVLTLMPHRRVCESENFTYHQYCSNLNIINLCFTDDLFLFAHGDVDFVIIIMEALDEFKNASELVPSLPKSIAYFCNVLNYVKLDILSVLPFEEVKNKVNDWKNKFFSFAGMVQLVQFVLGFMHVYWASVFIIPSRILLDIELLMRGFIWCQCEMRKCKAKVTWEAVCLPKREVRYRSLLRHMDIHNACFDMSSKKTLNDVDTTFSVATVWDCIRPRGNEIEWYNLVWFSHSIHSPCDLPLVGDQTEVEDSRHTEAMGSSCYFVWQERNYRLFKNQKRSKDQIIDVIKSTVYLKILSCKFKKKNNVKALLHLWKLPNSLIRLIMTEVFHDLKALAVTCEDVDGDYRRNSDGRLNGVGLQVVVVVNAIPQGIHVWIRKVGGDAFTILVLGLLFLCDLLLQSIFRHLNSNDYERELSTAGDAQRQARHFKWGLKKWVLDRIVNTNYTNVAQLAAAARNIELLHESGNSNKRDRDGNRIQNRGQGQQENKGRSGPGLKEVTETLPPPSLGSTSWKASPVFVIRLLGDVLLAGLSLRCKGLSPREASRTTSSFTPSMKKNMSTSSNCVEILRQKNVVCEVFEVRSLVKQVAVSLATTVHGGEKFSGACWAITDVLLRGFLPIALPLTRLMEKGYTMMIEERFGLWFDANWDVIATLQASLKPYESRLGMLRSFLWYEDSLVALLGEYEDESNSCYRSKEAQGTTVELGAIVQNVEFVELREKVYDGAHCFLHLLFISQASTIMKAWGELVLSSVQAFHPQTVMVSQEEDRSDFGIYVKGLCFVAVAKEEIEARLDRDRRVFADKHRRDLEFQVGDVYFLRVSPFRGVLTFWGSRACSSLDSSVRLILERYWRGFVIVPWRFLPLLLHVHDIRTDMSLSEEPDSFWIGKERVMEK